MTVEEKTWDACHPNHQFKIADMRDFREFSLGLGGRVIRKVTMRRHLDQIADAAPFKAPI